LAIFAFCSLKDVSSDQPRLVCAADVSLISLVLLFRAMKDFHGHWSQIGHGNWVIPGILFSSFAAAMLVARHGNRYCLEKKNGTSQ
jgi:hypothetical protein